MQRTTVQVGRLRFRIGCSRPEVGQPLRRALAPYVVADDAVAPEAYVLATPAGGKGLYSLYRFDCPVARARSAARLLDALRRHLAADAGWHPSGTVTVRAVALSTSAGVVLLPDGLRRTIVPRSRRLVAGGVAPLDEPVLGIAPGTGRVVVPPAPLDLPTEAVSAFGALGGDEAPQAPGAYQLRGISVPAVDADDRPAVRALHLLALVTGGPSDPERTLDAVLTAVERAESVPIPTRDVSDPAALLSHLS